MTLNKWSEKINRAIDKKRYISITHYPSGGIVGRVISFDNESLNVIGFCEREITTIKISNILDLKFSSKYLD